MVEILVTSYENPDLDGTACAVSYAEFLQKQGFDALAGIFGTLHRETEFIIKFGQFSAPLQAEELLTSQTKVVLVDASDTTGISKTIKAEQVVEVIDHRKINESAKFTNARIQIELVGSAATLIAEKFCEQNISISEQSALFLYAAIISNTINFRASVATKRDRKMTEWIKSFHYIPENFIHEMFKAKSTLKQPDKAIFEHDFALIQMNNITIGIIQLEFMNVGNYIKNNTKEIRTILREIKQEKSLNMIFLTAIDIEEATNNFLVIEPETEKLLKALLKVDFIDGVAHKNGILMRKQITPLIKKYLAKTN